MTDVQIIGIAVLIPAVYMYVKFRMYSLGHQFRASLLDQADKLRSSGLLTVRDRRIVQLAVENCDSAQFAWLLAVSFLPVWIYRRFFGGGRPTNQRVNRPGYADQMDLFEQTFLKSVMATSPAASLLFDISWLIAICVYVPYRRALDTVLAVSAARFIAN